MSMLDGPDDDDLEIRRVKGPEKCPRPCVECSDGLHHWIYNYDYNGDGEAEPEFECKHCDAIGEEDLTENTTRG